MFSDMTDSLVVYSHSSTVVDAVRAFTAGFDQLADATIDPAQEQAIRDYYYDHFVKMVEAYIGGKVQVDPLLPTSNAQKYLQAHYTAPFIEWAETLKRVDAGDASAWTAASIRYHGFFREIVSRFEFNTLVLIDPRGNVVYSAYKGAELGTNVLTGPYRGTALTDAYQKAIGAVAVDDVVVTDFGDYEPSDMPTAWLMSPIGPQGRVEGVLALQFPISKINRLMTINQKWEAAGLGRTGETFIVGPDSLMRSDSRLFLEDPEAYARDAVAAGASPGVIAKAIRQHGTTLVQPDAIYATRLARQGQTGSVIIRNYLGNETLQSYAPVDLPGLHWSVVAMIDTSEAFAPGSAFTRTVVLSTAVIIFVVCVAAMMLAQLFVRPIRQLEARARRISAGEYDVNLPVTTRDEFGDLTVAFNEMSRNLTIKESLLNEQHKENDRLLLSLMPEAVMQRYRGGEETIAQDYPNVTVIFADFDGLDELAAKLSSEETLSIVNRLVRQFDAAAENIGVERVRTLHNGYLAGCGLSVPRLDSVRRTVDFAVEMQRIVGRFNSETGHDLKLRAGIDTGAVKGGLVGRSIVAYDMWGSTVNLACQVRSGSPQPGVYVTSRVYEAMAESCEFTSAGAVTVAGADEPIWLLSEHQP